MTKKKSNRRFKRASRKKQSKSLQSFFIRPLQLFNIAAVSWFLLLLPGQNIYYRIIVEEGQVFQEEQTIALPSPALYPTNVTGYFPDHLSAQGIMVSDFFSSVPLFERNINQKMAPASTTKMMTALVALDAYSSDTILTVKTLVTQGHVMGLIEGERITAENLLYGILIHSANDAAFTLAENFPGGVNQFVATMNKKAQDLHLTNTHFENPIGFDNEEQYSTPRDLLILAKEVLKKREISKMVGIPSITVSDVDYTTFHPLKNVNELVGKVPGVAGVKTGFTEQAGQSLVTLANREGHKVLIVLLNSQDRFAETKELIDWVFGNYVWEEV